MTDQKLKKLSRKELLEVMLTQSREIEQLKAELDAANQKLASREICIRDAGSIAEAALRLNQIFQDADAASQQYLVSIQRMEQQEKEALARIQAKERQLQAKMEKTAGQGADEIPSVWRKIT
jgi:hypothetical protein